MVESVKQGVIGLMMLVGHWLAPSGQQASVEVEKTIMSENRYKVYCSMDMAWNNQLGQLVDAGIPLRLKFHCTTNTGDTTVFYRTLHCNILDYTYTYTDSSKTGVIRYKNYKLVYLALADFTCWEYTVSPRATLGYIDISLLTSWVSRLNREVDMSLVWGQKKVTKEFSIPLKKKSKKK